MTGEEGQAEPDEVDVVRVDSEGGKQETEGGNESKHDPLLPVDRLLNPFKVDKSRLGRRVITTARYGARPGGGPVARSPGGVVARWSRLRGGRARWTVGPVE